MLLDKREGTVKSLETEVDSQVVRIQKGFITGADVSSQCCAERASSTDPTAASGL